VRVLLLAPHPFFQPRGTPIAEAALLHVLSERGDEVEVLTFAEGEEVAIPRCTIRRIPRIPGVRDLRPGFSAKKLLCDAVMLLQCLRRVRSGRFDVIHAVEESAFMAAAARALFGVPYVYDMDSSLPQQMMEKYPVLAIVRRVMEAAESLVVRKSVAVVTVCQSLEEVARRYDPSRPVGRVEDFSLLSDGGGHPAERLAETIGKSGPIVLYAGNLEAYQGIDLLLAGFAHAVRKVPDVQAVIIGGDAGTIARYRSLAGRLEVAESVHFVGPRPVAALGSYLEQAAVVVSPRTKGQNTPMKIYSYLDSGRPLLATRLPMHTQVLDDDVAVLVEPHPMALGEGLVRLLNSDDRGASLAREAKRRVRAEFSREAFHRKMAAFYARVEREVAADGRRAG
jgi:glycosyltransferase involved in cell wall biosynthesis